MSHDVLRLTRDVPAAPPRVWAAWTTIDGLASWWWTHWPATTYAVDLRVGGAYRIEDREHGVGVRGDYLALDAPRRLEATWVWLDDGVEGDLEHLEVSLEARGEGTRVEVVHSGPWTTPVPGETYRTGWEHVLTALAELPPEAGQRRA